MFEFLDLQCLLRSDPSDVAAHLIELKTKYDEPAITAALLEALEAQMIPAVILPTWLAIAKQPESLKAVLLQEISRFGRLQAIRYVGKWLRRNEEDSDQIWIAIGGVNGIVHLLENMSVNEVMHMLRAIGSSYRLHLAQKEIQVTEVFKTLCSNTTLAPIFERVENPNTEKRPLLHLYLDLLPSCTSECVETVVKEKPDLIQKWKRAHYLLRSHTILMQGFYRHGKANQLPFLSKLCVNEPPLSGSQPGFSSTMSFKWSMLKDYVGFHSESTQLQASSIDLAQGMFRIALSKGLSRQWLERIANASIYFYEHNPHLVHNLEPIKNPMLGKIIHWWSRAQKDEPNSTKHQAYELWLTRIFFLIKQTKPHNVVVDGSFLKHAERIHRYRLLRIISTTYLNYDIDNEECLKHYKFATEVFDMLSQEYAIHLLERLIDARPKLDFIQPHHSVNLLTITDPLATRTAVLVLLAKLKGNKEESLQLIVERMDAQKQKTYEAKAAAERARLAVSVAQYATFGSSLILLDDVCRWMSRLTRDSLTISKLFSHRAMTSLNNTVVLSAISYKFNDQAPRPTVDKVLNDVLFANNIIRMLFQLVLDAKKEPFFKVAYWNSVRELLKDVIQHRLACATDLQKKLSFSDEDMSAAIWKDTLELFSEMVLISFKLGLQEIHVDLLSFAPNRNAKQIYLSKVSLTFLDNIAQFLDELWQSRRIFAKPAVSVLSEPFPKGLPIQKLVSGFPEDAGWSVEDSPFIISRARNVALMKAEVAMGSFPSEEMQLNIEIFCEDFHFAVMIYVFEAESNCQQMTRLEEVWRHWITVLCEYGTMRSLDAATWLRRALVDDRCKPYLKKALNSFDPKEDTYNHYPSLPQPPKHQQILEWNPVEQEPQQIEGRYSLAAVDCLIHAATPNMTSDWSKMFERRVLRDVPRFWSPRRLGNRTAFVTGDVAEGMIVTSILCLDKHIISKIPLIGTTFPSDELTRYPALYLDSEFLDREELNTPEDCFGTLTRFHFRAPLALLDTLISRFMDTLRSTMADLGARATIEAICFRLIKLFAREDQPQLAARFIINIILERPQSSTWHRQLLTVRYLRSLSASQAQAFVDNFAKEIIIRWEAQVKQPASAVQSDRNRVVPVIKVTTVKQLAEILKDADYIPADFSIKILSSIFYQASHIDIRAATLDAIVELMHNSHDDEALMTQIMAFFESTVPIIGAFNERQVFTEKQWKEAESTLSIPSPFSENASERPPLSTKLATDIKLPEKFEKHFVDAVLIPAMELSKQNKKRWMRIVLKKYGGSESLANLAFPMDLESFSIILCDYRAYLPREHYQNWHALIKENLDPSPAFKRMQDLFQDNLELEFSPTGRFWWANFRQDWVRYTSSNMLSVEWKGTKRTDGKGITIELVQKWWLEVAIIVLEKHSTPRMEKMEEFLLPGISPRLHQHDAHSANSQNQANVRDWLANARPVLQQFIAKVEEKRTTTWQSDVNRRPSFLPSSMRLGLCLLPFPFLSTEGTDEERCSIFARAIFHSVKRVPDALRQRILMPMKALRECIMNCSAENDDVNRTICYLGDIEKLDNGKITAAAMFCLDLCEELLSEWKGDLKGPVWELAQDTVKRWATSENEAVRYLGHLTLPRFRVEAQGFFKSSGTAMRTRGGRYQRRARR